MVWVPPCPVFSKAQTVLGYGDKFLTMHTSQAEIYKGHFCILIAHFFLWEVHMKWGC